MRLFTFCSMIFLFALFASAEIVNVPGDQPTIQEGINAASDGDTVLVAENTYYENINFKGKAITVASYFILDGDTSHISRTIINGSQPNHPDSGSVVLFCSGEDTTSVLCGFSITGGTGTIHPPEPAIPHPGYLRAGGGIACILSGARICHNKVYGNSVDHDPIGFGGGISSGGLPNTKTVIIESNEVFNNSATATEWTKGGGISLAVSAIVRNNRIHHNTVSGDFYHPLGGIQAGGLWCSSEADSNRTLILENNHIFSNTVISKNTEMINAWGGGVVIYTTEVLMKNNVIYDNAISSASLSFGAGVFLNVLTDKSIICNNIIRDNKRDTGKCYGGGLCVWRGNPRVVNNLIAGNSAYYGGGICAGQEYSDPLFVNNTVVDNTATYGGGVYVYRSNPAILNSIFWENNAGAGKEIFVYSGSLDITYSNVQGSWTGEGNIDVDPLFVTDTLFCLSDASACIDAGNPAPEYNDTEDPLNTGQALWPAKGTLRNDLGAYGGSGQLLTTVDFFDRQVNFSDQFRLEQNYPNPFNPVTVIPYRLAVSSFVDLSIYNLLGQKVATLVATRQPAGSYQIEWDASGFSSGVYFCRLQTAQGFVQIRKLMVLK